MTVRSRAPALAELTTMRVGGAPRRLVEVDSAEALAEAVRSADDQGEPLLVVSGGSNLVVADEGFPGTAVLVRNRGVAVESDDACGGVVVRVAAGEPWDDLVARAVTESWSGIEALAGIPGSTGATPVQNVGAYGQEVAQTIWSVRVYDRVARRVRTLANADCDFSYRHSLLKESMRLHDVGGGRQVTPRYVVLEVTFQLRPTELSQPIGYADLARHLDVDPGARVPLADARQAVLEQRGRRGMVLQDADHDTWSCGSFFTNPILSEDDMAQVRERVCGRLGADGPVLPEFPAHDGTVKTSAAWLIDKAGFTKGYALPGPVALSTKHSLAVTNRGSATASEVVALARQLRDGVDDAFGVSLVNEPVLVGLDL